jgi:hypothetical protein
VLVLKSEQ